MKPPVGARHDFLAAPAHAELLRRLDDLLPRLLEVLGSEAPRPQRIKAEVLRTAVDYLSIAQAYRRSPSRKRLREDLELLRDTARMASVLLQRKDPHLLAALRLGGLPEPVANDLHRGLGPNVAILFSAIGSISDAAANTLSLSGPASGQPAWANPPKRALAYDCARIFRRLTGRRPSSTASGSFQTFVGYVYEVATGEEDAELERPIKEALKAIKRGFVDSPGNPFAEGINPLRKYERALKGQ